MKKKKIDYAPLTKLIAFDRDAPRVVWTPSTEIFASAVVFTDGKALVRITAKYEEAVEGRCSIVSAEKVFLYTESLWHACQSWLEKKKELDDLYAQLKKGRVPLELHDFRQVPLLE